MKLTRRLRALLLVPSLLALPAVAASQERPGVLEGRVLSAGTGEPVPGVLLRFDSGTEVLADREGVFVVEGLEPGTHGVLLVTPGCRVSRGEVEVAAGTLHRAELFVPGLVAARTPAPREQRSVNPGALVVTQAQMRGMRHRSVTEVVRQVVPSMVGNAGGRVGGYARLQSRSINSLVDRNPPVVVVDGVRVSDGAEALDLLHPSDVERLEILRGAAAGWEFGSSGSAGAILVTTRQGRGSAAAGSTVTGRTPADPRACPLPGGGEGI